MPRSMMVLFVSAMGFLVSLSDLARADERQDAAQAANEIMTALGDQRYNHVWNNLMSAFFKERMNKDSFLANMSIGRGPMGKPKSSKIVDIQFATHDPGTGMTGRIYAVTFDNEYGPGRFYERVVVLREDDGVFRLAGLWGSPAPTE